MKWDSINQLCDIVRETGFAIHTFHKNGHLEKVYENALVHRLKKLNLEVEQQYPLAVYDEDGTRIGEHIAQILGYLKSSRIENGLLINFGSPKLQIKKYILTQR